MSNDKETVIFRRNKNTKNNDTKKENNLNNLNEPVTEVVDYGTLDDIKPVDKKKKK